MTVNNERSDVNSVEFYRDQVARIVPASGQIYDITHADTNEHSVALPTGYPANTRAILVRTDRVGGTGSFRMRSVSGAATYITTAPGAHGLWIRASDGLFWYSLQTASDDWDIFANGYITGGS